MTRENRIAIVLEWLLDGDMVVTIPVVAKHLGVSRAVARGILFAALAYADGGWGFVRRGSAATSYFFSRTVRERALGVRPAAPWNGAHQP